MLKLRIENRIPLALFNKVHFLYAGPDLMSFPLGMISNVLDYAGRSLQRYHPMTVSKVVGERFLIDQMFCFSFLYIDDEGELVLFLTHPYWFDRTSIEECLKFFLKEVEELAKINNCRCIKLEFHDEYSSIVSFPNSLSDFSYELSDMEIQKQDLYRFQQNGFVEKNVVLCYEQSIKEIKEKMKYVLHKCKSYIIDSVDRSEFINMERKLENFNAKSYSLSNRDLIVSQRFIPSFKDAIFVAHKRSNLVGDSTLDGFLRWSPNFLELVKKYRTPVPYLFNSILKNNNFKVGKIFSWALREKKAKLFLCLLSHVINSMKQNGLENCQIAYVDNEQNFMKNILERYGFIKIHTIKILEKRVS